MEIKLIKDQSDHTLPCLDIYFSNATEAFSIGRIFENINKESLAAWSTKRGIRIPLVITNNIGIVDVRLPCNQIQNGVKTEDIDKICLNYRSDFDSLDLQVQKQMRSTCKEWIEAIKKSKL